MPNIGKITVENPEEILNAGAYGTGAVVKVQWSATEAGTYADLTGTGSTPSIAVVSGTRAYTFYDPNGIVSTWYRTRYENVGATRLSDWTPSFQVGDETAGMLCSIYDVKQELGIDAATTTDDELILEKIRQVSAMIETYTGRWFAPRPLNGTVVLTFDTYYGRALRIPRGIRSITTLETATWDQPETGGVYITATVGDYFLHPTPAERDANWPATSVMFTSMGILFYTAAYGARITGQFGWASVPPDIQGIAISAVVRRYMTKESRSADLAVVGPSGTMTILRGISPAEQDQLHQYRRREDGR